VQRLKLFGGVSIETESGPLTGRAVQRRRLALLAMLAAARTRGVGRDRLITFLWPDADAENGRSFLSDSVYRINQALGGDVILSAGEDLRLDATRLPSDLDEFEEALARGNQDEAVRTYAGPFLDGFFLPEAIEFERWTEGERERLGRQYARALEALAVAAEQEGRPAAAVDWWRKLAAQDPYNSRVALHLMQSLVAAGERAAAIQHARVHETLLRQELDIEPDAAVRTLAEQLKHDAVRVAAMPAIVTPVTMMAAAPAASTPDSAPAAAPAPTDGVRTISPVTHMTPRRIPRVVLAAGALAFVALGVTATVMARERWGVASRAEPATMRTIAVLPFVNLSADRENEYFSDGITEELITTLGQIPGLRVASRTSAFAYKNKAVDVREVGRRLGAAAVVEGGVRRSGRTLRVTAQLVDAATGYDLWSATYDRDAAEVFAIQEEISRAIAARLVGTLGAVERVTLAERSTRDPVTYDLYLKGRHAWHERTREGLARAIEHFSQAVAREPDYARAHVGLGDAFAVSAFYDYQPPREAYPKAEAAARRAIELDPALAAPHATMGYILTYYHMDWSRSDEAFKRALAADPDNATAHQWYGNLLTVGARFDDAEREFRSAQEADPLSLIAQAALGWSYYYAGKYDAALEECRRTLALNPNFELAHLWGAWALIELGRVAEAREWVERAVELSKRSPLTRLALAYVLGRSGSEADKAAARAVVREMELRRARGEYLPAYEIAKVHLALADHAAALTWLKRAVDDASHSRAFFRVDPQLAVLRGDPRFEALMVASGRPRLEGGG
jgi:TolB-like protein/DNA-binding SARP family transcriptional activator/Tfp pilus assembly protein PilF